MSSKQNINLGEDRKMPNKGIISKNLMSTDIKECLDKSTIAENCPPTESQTHSCENNPSISRKSNLVSNRVLATIDCNLLQRSEKLRDNLNEKQCKPDKKIVLKRMGLLCRFCHLICRNRSLLIKHMKIHTKEKPFQCFTCGKTFAIKKSLDDHEIAHSGQSFPCSICGTALKTKDSLEKHNLLHSGEKSHQCSQCTKRFRLATLLNSHVKRVHAQEKKYRCRDCGKLWFNRSALQRHMRIHSSYPLRCELCGKGFFQSGNLQGHLRVHTNEKPFKCDDCGKAFTYNHVMKQHRIKHHQSENNVPI